MADYKPTDERLTSPYDPNYLGADYPVAKTPPQSGGVVSFLSTNERNGRWDLPRHFRVLAVLGNVELDLREAEIGLGVSVIEAVAVMGNIEITVPPDVAVESEGDSLMGSFAVKYAKGVSAGMATGYKKLRIAGTAYAANVEIRVKGPDKPMLARIGKRLGIK
jgi:hypothetical protein